MENPREKLTPEEQHTESSKMFDTKCALCGKGWKLGVGEWKSCMGGGRDSKGKKFKDHEPIYIGVKKNGVILDNYGGDFEYFRREFER